MIATMKELRTELFNRISARNSSQTSERIQTWLSALTIDLQESTSKRSQLSDFKDFQLKSI